MILHPDPVPGLPEALGVPAESQQGSPSLGCFRLFQVTEATGGVAAPGERVLTPDQMQMT